MNRDGASFNEIVALLSRNETGGDDGDEGLRDQRDARDIERDLERLLLLSRDAKQRDQLVQAQAVRRITLIAKQTVAPGVQRCSAALLCNLAASERGRLSASSCDRWHCVSHRHNCPLAMLLRETVNRSSDLRYRQLSAAALLSFSVQNECQTHVDFIGGLPLLLRVLHDARDDSDVRVFVAATLWNLTKSPLLLLKLETVHGILKDRLIRELTDIIATPLASCQLSITPTGERGTTGLLESDSTDNLGLMLAASVSTQLAIVFRVENYVGRPRSLTDQYRVKTPVRRHRDNEIVEGQSVAHFDERGVLQSRTCAVCAKSIKLRKRRTTLFLACARDGCEQTFHPQCSRWKTLSEERRDQHAHAFYCATCLPQNPVVHYCDFLADDLKHDALVTETRFPSVGVQRVAVSNDGGPAYTALLDKATDDVVAVGVKRYRIPPSSVDLEMFIVAICYVRLSAAPATQQTQLNRSRSPSPLVSLTPSIPKGDWSISYARDGATALPVAPGSVVFWPGPFLQDLDASLYTQLSLAELESVYLYEFRGETAADTTYSFGRPLMSTRTEPITPALWTTLYPRRGVCMKLLAEQIGHHKQLNELLGNNRATTTTKTAVPSSKKTVRKPLLRKLSRVAAATSLP